MMVMEDTYRLLLENDKFYAKGLLSLIQASIGTAGIQAG